jgi:hypothetical protein
VEAYLSWLLLVALGMLSAGEESFFVGFRNAAQSIPNATSRSQLRYASTVRVPGPEPQHLGWFATVAPHIA